jgi:RNA recognition motif-containing protein
LLNFDNLGCSLEGSIDRASASTEGSVTTADYRSESTASSSTGLLKDLPPGFQGQMNVNGIVRAENIPWERRAARIPAKKAAPPPVASLNLIKPKETIKNAPTIPKTVINSLTQEGHNVYVRGLPHDCNDAMLRSMVASIGNVISVKAIMDYKVDYQPQDSVSLASSLGSATSAKDAFLFAPTLGLSPSLPFGQAPVVSPVEAALKEGRCKGYGFVMFSNKEDAHKAVDYLKSLGLHASLAKESLSEKLKQVEDCHSKNLYFTGLPPYLDEEGITSLILSALERNWSGKATPFGIKPISPNPLNPLITATFNAVIFGESTRVSNPVESARILRTKDGKSKCVGFARMSSRTLAEQVIAIMNGCVISGWKSRVHVRFADSIKQKEIKSKEQRWSD